MRRLLIRMSFAAIGEGGRTRTSGSGFLPHGRMSAGDPLSPGSVATSLTPSFSKSNKKPGLSRVWCALREMHSDPQDTTPQMTRFVVILTMSRLKVLSIASIHRLHFRVLTVARIWSARQDSNLRALRS